MPVIDAKPAPVHSARTFPRRVRTVAVPFTVEDDSAVTWAVQSIEESGLSELVVIHPDRRGVSDADLAQLRDRFAWHLAGRFRVTAVRTGDGFPALRLIRAS